MAGAKDVSTPMSTTQYLHLLDGTTSMDNTKYRRIIESLQYLSLTRPNISFVVNKLFQFIHKPTITHWTATKRLLWYLKKTIFHDIHIKKVAAHCLTTYNDADWAGSIDDKISTLDDITFLGYNPISWSLKKQRVVARSTTEAEYRALANGTSETMWLLALLHELGFPLKVPPSLLCDKS